MHAQIGELIAGAMAKVGRAGVVTMEESRTAEDHLYVVEGMQFERGYISPYFVTDPERMVSFRLSSEDLSTISSPGDHLYVVEGVQFERRYISSYFLTRSA